MENPANCDLQGFELGAIMPANYLQVPSAAVKDDSGKFHCWIGDRHLQFLRGVSKHEQQV